MFARGLRRRDQRSRRAGLVLARAASRNKELEDLHRQQ
jgi:hypothetical protein